jgi:hypothetical protein
MKTKWHVIEKFYNFDNLQITHKKKSEFVKLPCVYKIRIDNKVVHVGRSDTCKKHGGAEKVRKALVQLLHLYEHNKSVEPTSYWEHIRQEYHPSPVNIEIGIIETDDIENVYSKESKRTH